MTTVTKNEHEIPLVNVDARVIRAAEKLDQLRERVRSAERALYAGAMADDTAARVSRLVADPAAVLTRAPAITADDLRALRAAADAAEREVARVRQQVSVEFARAIAPERRSRASDLVDALSRALALLDEEITLAASLTAKGHEPVHRLAYPPDRDALQRLLDRVQRAAEVLR